MMGIIKLQKLQEEKPQIVNNDCKAYMGVVINDEAKNWDRSGNLWKRDFSECP